MCGAVGDDIADDAHTGRRRVDVRITHHEFFQYVVLNRPRQCGLVNALLFSRNNIACEHRQHRTVHRHGNRDLVEGDAIEQNLHVLNGVDRHACFAYVARHARMIGVVSTMSRQIECHRDTLSTCR